MLITTDLVGCSKADSEDTSYTEESNASDVLDNDIAELILHELTRPEYNGRNTGTEEIRQASLFLADIYEDIGLKMWAGDSFVMTYTNADAIELIDESIKDDHGHNIVGVIPGRDRTKAVIVTAHYDAKGGGEGALDNASGVATMLHVANGLLIGGAQPETDVVFCAYDGEELGLIGSKIFAPIAIAHYAELYNINIDVVGFAADPLTIDISQANERNRLLREDFAELLADAEIPYIDMPLETGIIAWVSDHASFDRLGIANINLGTLSDEIIVTIDSERDVVDLVDIALIEKLADAIKAFIVINHGKMY